MKKITLSALLLAASMLAFFSCSKEQAVPTTTTTSEVDYQKVKNDIRQSWETIRNVQGIKDMDLETRAGQFIVVPAGSTNALVKAITDAGEGGIVYLKSGLHTETSNITIKQRVVLIGEDGAVLKIQAPLTPYDANGILTLKPGIHFFNAPRSLVQNIDIQPIGPNGGEALLFENSDQSGVMFNKTADFQFSFIVEKSNQMTIMGNKLVSNTLWQTDPLIECDAILNINGLSTYIANNEISNALSGTFSSDWYGTFANNTMKNNFLGIILCKFVENSVKLPSGELTGAKKSCGYWKVRNNISTDNVGFGYLVIDGANNNILEGNQATRNGFYDIELAGDSNRFGFFTPTSFKNTLHALAGQKVKNCGNNNTIVGGIMVDLTASPCN